MLFSLIILIFSSIPLIFSHLHSMLLIFAKILLHPSPFHSIIFLPTRHLGEKKTCTYCTKISFHLIHSHAFQKIFTPLYPRYTHIYFTIWLYMPPKLKLHLFCSKGRKLALLFCTSPFAQSWAQPLMPKPVTPSSANHHKACIGTSERTSFPQSLFGKISCF